MSSDPSALFVFLASALLGLGLAYASLIGAVHVGLRRVLRPFAREGEADARLRGDGVRTLREVALRGDGVPGDGRSEGEGRGEDEVGAVVDVAAHPPDDDAHWPFVSVVVPARDEEDGIETCVRSILACDYPAGRFEVIVVDDFSRDATPRLVQRMRRTRSAVRTSALALADAAPEAPEAPRLRLMQMADVVPTEAHSHKRRALDHGLAEARGDVLVTTDADCTVRPGWLRAMVAPLRHDARVAFVSGPVAYRPGRSLFGRVQALEFLGMIAFGAGTLGLDWPTTCNSANVAFRRAAHDWFRQREAEAGPSTGAGSDEVLIQLLARETDWTVRFTAAHAAVVTTDPVPTLRAFMRQRQRWASMGPRYPSRRHRVALRTTWAFHVALTLATLLLPLMPGLAPAVALALAAKALPEAAVLVRAARHFDRRPLLPLMPLMQIMHVPYVAIAGTMGLWGTVRWKDRAIE